MKTQMTQIQLLSYEVLYEFLSDSTQEEADSPMSLFSNEDEVACSQIMC